jgi:pSer/pThr/pTyr-binding forkhead associated (FHA) protein
MLVKLRITNGKHAGTTYVVWKTPYVVGRHALANLRIDNRRVSVHHCSVVLRGTEVWVRDMNSTNGTAVNDAVLEPGGEKRLSIGDRIQVGPAVLEVLQEATGVVPLHDRDEYTPTDPALPVSPKTIKTAKPPAPTRRALRDE